MYLYFILRVLRYVSRVTNLELQEHIHVHTEKVWYFDISDGYTRRCRPSLSGKKYNYRSSAHLSPDVDPGLADRRTPPKRVEREVPQQGAGGLVTPADWVAQVGNLRVDENGILLRPKPD